MLSVKVLTTSDIGRTASYYAESADDYYKKDINAIDWQLVHIFALLYF